MLHKAILCICTGPSILSRLRLLVCTSSKDVFTTILNQCGEVLVVLRPLLLLLLLLPPLLLGGPALLGISAPRPAACGCDLVRARKHALAWLLVPSSL